MANSAILRFPRRRHLSAILSRICFLVPLSAIMVSFIPSPPAGFTPRLCYLYRSTCGALLAFGLDDAPHLARQITIDIVLSFRCIILAIATCRHPLCHKARMRLFRSTFVLFAISHTLPQPVLFVNRTSVLVLGQTKKHPLPFSRG